MRKTTVLIALALLAAAAAPRADAFDRVLVGGQLRVITPTGANADGQVQAWLTVYFRTEVVVDVAAFGPGVTKVTVNGHRATWRQLRPLDRVSFLIRDNVTVEILATRP